MSGTSARESLRSTRRMRSADNQPTSSMPPVLFRLPSIAMPAVAMDEPAVDASSGNIAMMPAAIVMPAQAVPPNSSSSASISESNANTAARPALAQEKAAGRNLLNLLIVILLIAALLVITWISMSSPGSAPGIAHDDHDHHAGDAALDTLGELKVPAVSGGITGSTPGSSDSNTLQPNSTTPVPELSLEPKPSLILASDSSHDSSLSSDLSNSDLSNKVDNAQSGSLLSGLDTTGTNPTDLTATRNANSQPLASSSAQIQLRTPVPMGSTSTSLVDSQRPSSTLSATLNSPSTRVDTVSSPTNVTKNNQGQVFPANPEAASSTLGNTNSSSTTGGANTGASPSLWDGAKKPVEEGLQLSGLQPGSTLPSYPSSTGPSQVNISKPISAELNVPRSGTASQTFGSAGSAPALASQSTAQQVELGVTVGAGSKEPYSLPTPRSTATPEFDDAALARTYNQLKQTNATAQASATGPTATKPINSYATGTGQATAGQNLYQNGYVKPAPTNSMNSYTGIANNVPAGVTGAPTGPYVPPVQNSYANMPGYPNTQMMPGNQAVGSLASGPTSAPTSLPGYTNTMAGSGYAVPARNNQATGYVQQTPYGQTAPAQQPNYNQPAQAQTYSQPQGYQQPAYTQPGNPQPNYPQPNYSQPNYSQPTGGYGPTGGYAPSGSGYPNPGYPTATGMMPGQMPSANTSRPTGSYQNAATYPVSNSPYPGGQVPGGMIGSSGYATAPSGDVAPARPVMGTMGSGTSMPYGTP